MENMLPFDSIEKFSFVKKPISISPDLRIIRRIALILLIMRITTRRNSSTSLSKIQLILWGLNSIKNHTKLVDFDIREKNGGDVYIHYNPYVNRACDFALAFGFIEQMKTRQGKFKVTPLGNQYLDFLFEDRSLLRYEKIILKRIGNKFSERVINDIRMGVL